MKSTFTVLILVLSLALVAAAQVHSADSVAIRMSSEAWDAARHQIQPVRVIDYGSFVWI